MINILEHQEPESSHDKVDRSTHKVGDPKLAYWQKGSAIK